MISLIMWNLKTGQINLFKKQKHRDTENKLMGTKGEGEGINQEYGINRCTLTYINSNLLYFTGNYIQDLVITNNGKQQENTHTHIHIKPNHFAVYLKHNIVNQFYFS